MTQDNLDNLLKVKKLEKPDQAFWDQFDKELQERALHELVRKPSLSEQFSHYSSLYLKPVLSVAGAAAITLMVVLSPSSQTPPTLVAAHTPPPPTALDYVDTNFVKNSINTDPDYSHNFTKLLSSPTIPASGVHYVAGNIATPTFSNNLF